MILKLLFVLSGIKLIPKNHLVELGGIFLPFSLFLFYNLLLTTTDWFEFDSINTAVGSTHLFMFVFGLCWHTL
jgi:hypothetical protein